MIKPGIYKNYPCLTIKVIPGASRNAIQNWDTELRIAIAAPPEKGKANQELIAFLAKTFGMKKSEIDVVQGQTSRIKLVTFSHITEAILQKKLEELQKKTGSLEEKK